MLQFHCRTVHHARDASATSSPSSVARREDDAAGAVSEPAREIPGALAACVRRLDATVNPELALALGALAYDHASEDACRLSLAAQFADPSLCDGITYGTLRRTCELHVAIRTGAPESCPAARVDHGRDPLCVAVAARVPTLCAAAGATEQVSCVAASTHDAAACDALDPSLRAGCRAVVALLDAPLARRMPARAVTRSTIGLGEMVDGGGDVRVLRAFDRGVWLVGDALVMVDPVNAWPSETAVPPAHDDVSIGLLLTMPARRGAGTLQRLTVVLGDGRAITLPVTGPPPDVEFDAVGRTRGARIAGRVRVMGDAAGSAVPVEIVFETFVRDVLADGDAGLPAAFADLVPGG